MSIGVFDTDGAAKRVAHKGKLLRQGQILADLVDVGNQFLHGVTGEWPITLSMPSKIGGDNPVVLDKVVDLMLPGVDAAGVAMYKHDGALYTFRLNVDDA